MLATMAFAVSISSVGQMPLIFPCEPGKVLTYKGTGRWQHGSDPDTILEDATSTTTFLRCSYSPTKAVAIVRGLPGDLAWENAPDTYAIIQTPDALYIEEIAYTPDLDPQTIDIPAERDAHDQYLHFPLKAAACAYVENDRTDGDYCWLLDSIGKDRDKPVWNLAYYTLPDATVMTIEPGVGITAYSYEHHGTVAEVDVKLVRQTK